MIWYGSWLEYASLAKIPGAGTLICSPVKVKLSAWAIGADGVAANAVAVAKGVDVRTTGVADGGLWVEVAVGNGVAEGVIWEDVAVAMGVAVGITEVAVGGIEVAVAARVAVGGAGVAVAMEVAVG
jgi:hypothetical protein